MIDSNKKSIIINSKNFGKSTDFTYLFNKSIKINSYLKLVYAALPNTSYLVSNNSNNNLIVTFADATVKNINIDIGNYDVDSLATAIKTAINYSSFNMVFDKVKIKYQLTASQSFHVSGNMIAILGITDNQLFNSSNIYCDKCIYFTFPNILYIKIDNFDNPNIIYDKCKSVTFFVHNYALKSYNTYYYSYEYDNIMNINYPIELDSMHIQILDENFNVYDNLNTPIQIILEFE